MSGRIASGAAARRGFNGAFSDSTRSAPGWRNRRRARGPGGAAADEFTLLVIPDSQYLAAQWTNKAVMADYSAQISWIIKTAAAGPTVVLHEGDIVDKGQVIIHIHVMVGLQAAQRCPEFTEIFFPDVYHLFGWKSHPFGHILVNPLGNCPP